MPPIVTIQDLSKSYLLRHQQNRGAAFQYRSLREELGSAANRFFRRPPQTAKPSAQRSDREVFWALRDVSFEIERGEVLGIIGRNGAGKSTLLKILSRITHPTKGRIEMNGRVASLLEVGTGFHPELTGRENIFLNGAILGMSRLEIRAKFDEIVAFAEVERFLDTPVKRYSSGMYVRLAFAVAAHLDPDILIVDEVLAVGDVEFQKKCLNKMGEVKREGITVLFVSHNISAVKSFTDRCVLLSRGQLQMIAPTEPVISAYLNESSQSEAETVDFSASRGNHSRIRLARVSQENQTGDTVLAGQPFRVDVEVETDGTIDLSLTMFLRDQSGTKIGISCIYQFCGLKFPRTAGIHLCSVMLAPPWLASGTYSLDIATSRPNIDWDHYVESATRFHIPFSNPLNRSFEFRQSDDFGSIAIPFADTPTFKLSSTESSA